VHLPYVSCHSVKRYQASPVSWKRFPTKGRPGGPGGTFPFRDDLTDWKREWRIYMIAKPTIKVLFGGMEKPLNISVLAALVFMMLMSDV